jgi:hypothetical protein
MKRKTIPVVIVVVVLSVFFLLRGCGGSEERAIRRALDELVGRVALSECEDMVRAGLRSRRIGDSFVDDAQISAKTYGISLRGRQDVVTASLRVRTQLDRFTLEISGIEVSVRDDAQEAEVYCAVRVDVAGMGEEDRRYQEVEMSWSKTEEGWKIARLETVEIVRRPPHL